MSKQHEQWADEIAQRHWSDGEATAEGLAANIANVIEAAVEAERERIIKLVERFTVNGGSEDEFIIGPAIAKLIRHSSDFSATKEG